MVVKEFNYVSNNGNSKPRKVFVIKENNHYLEGLDLNLLPQADVDQITSKYKDFSPITDTTDTKVNLEDFNPAWNKAYRQFSKYKINSWFA